MFLASSRQREPSSHACTLTKMAVRRASQVTTEPMAVLCKAAPYDALATCCSHGQQVRPTMAAALVPSEGAIRANVGSLRALSQEGA